MIRRYVTEELERALIRQDSVALIGPRQVGKTTLALDAGESRASLYLDLEDMDDRNKLENPKLFLDAAKDRLVILDEIHRMPEIFQTLRGVIDKGRREGLGKGRFLILGSASIDLLKQSETLAGRIAYIHMTPLTLQELPHYTEVINTLWLRGGFPDPYLAVNDAESFLLLKDFIHTYLERDIPMFGPSVPSTTMERLWTMLAHHQGGIINASHLANGLDISSQSVTRYIDLLCDLLLVRRLPPLIANIGKRLVKSPKVYVRDTGLLHTLLGIHDLISLNGHPIVGQSWEGFIIENILSVIPHNAQTSFYRTSAGAEMDLVIDLIDGRRYCVEIKRGLNAKPTRGFYHAIEDLAPHYTYLVHAGHERYPLREKIEAIGILELLKVLNEDCG